MATDKILVIIAGLGGIAFTYWFFLMRRTKTVQTVGSADIVVSGGYTPESVSIPNDQKTVIYFLRKDPSSCLEEVVIPDFHIRKYLPLNEKTAVELTPRRRGEFPFSCGMGMYHGKIIVR
jgi:plastocyanin domain-containing protein